MNRIRHTALGLLLLALAVSASAETARPYLFGLNINMTDRECKLAKEAGCTSVRIGCGWDLVEREPGVYDFSQPDRDVAQCAKYGFEPFFLIAATPKFYLREDMRDRPYAWPALPEFYPQAEKFYRTLAERYKGKVRYYEFWNEENGKSWHAINKPEEYAPILKVAYKALKEGDPNCVVAVGGLDGAGWKGYYHYLEKLYELGCGDSFDAVAVHPYRVDGPIDVHGLNMIHEVLVRHGHGERKLWITEYGWSKEYGHDAKAKWLTESLDLLTSPELDFVFQASVHTLCDLDEAEYGLCDKECNPRPAYAAFKAYPKKWLHVRVRRAEAARSTVQGDSFESGALAWSRYGDWLRLTSSGPQSIKLESGLGFLCAKADDRALAGGVYRVCSVRPKIPMYAEARAYTDQRGDSAGNSRVRIGIDPEGGTDLSASTVIWGRWIDTSGEWDTVGVGRAQAIVSQSGRATVFLDYKQSGGAVGQISAFDNVTVVQK